MMMQLLMLLLFNVALFIEAFLGVLLVRQQSRIILGL